MKPNLLLAASATLLLAACSSGGSTTDTASDSAAVPTSTSTSAMPSQSTSPSPSPSPSPAVTRPTVPTAYLNSAQRMNAKIAEGTDLVNEATGGLDMDNYSRADRKDALRGFELLFDAANIGARAPLSRVPALDRAHNDLVNALTDFAVPGVEAFSTTDPVGEAEYLVAVFAAENYLMAFEAWIKTLGRVVE